MNDDGTDEIMYIYNSGGCNSALARGHLATYKNGKWKRVAGFDTRMDFDPLFDEPDIILQEDLRKRAVKDFERKLSEVPRFFKKKGQQILCREFEEGGAGPEVWRKVKVKW